MYLQGKGLMNFSLCTLVQSQKSLEEWSETNMSSYVLLMKIAYYKTAEFHQLYEAIKLDCYTVHQAQPYGTHAAALDPLRTEQC